ncbi:MAG: diguanylate cyclase [Chromatiales bacterium]|jgi:diguanylate cyclase (GGDEF)-like protein|nr:diguanylate cyclase [Chromatiales bacterium]
MTTHDASPSILPLTAEPTERPRLLVVDDQPINIQTLYQIFHADHEVFMATDGQQALDFCRHGMPPDLILLDVVMPGMDGLEVCRSLKADPATADIPVIFVTAQSDPADETRALEAGGVDFITKPVNPAVVRARVKTHLTLKAQSDLLRSLAFVDGLTGVANRRRFDEALETEWRGCRRGHLPLALLMVDIDHFKRYNDRYGHQAGDECLRIVARTLKQGFGRARDLVARYGGEEFACLMPGSDLAGARTKAEELRQAIERCAIPHAASPVADVVTLSVGVAALTPNGENTPSDLVAAADAALYSAKSEGRNRVCSAGESDLAPTAD